MSCYTLVVTVTILVIAFSPPNQFSALSANTFKNQHRASAERMEPTVRTIELQAHLKELREKREMDDDGIDLSTEVTYVRPRRQALKQTPMISLSSVKKDSCGIDLDVYQQLEDKKKIVKTTRTERKRIEQLLLNVKVTKERREENDLILQKQESDTTKQIEILMQEINKITDEGDAQLQSEKDKTNNAVSVLQTQIDNELKTTKNTEDLSELRAQVVRTTSDVNEQQKMNDEMKSQKDFEESRKQIVVQQYDTCIKMLADLKDMQNNFDGNQVIQIKRNDIRQNDELLGSKRDCCKQKGCDVYALELRV